MSGIAKRNLKLLAVAAGIAGIALPTMLLTSPVHASGGCTREEWSDGTTYGVRLVCDPYYSATYKAKATCKNSTIVEGAVVEAPAMSYAYCSSVGSTVYHGWDEIVP